MLCIDFSSAFNTILPNILVGKLQALGINTLVCNWVLDFLSNRTQSVRLGEYTSPTVTINTGAPQGCVNSPLFYTLYTHDCIASFPSNYILKFADDTTVAALIIKNDESEYRKEVEHLVTWCSEHNLVLNVMKTKEMIVDFRTGEHPIPPPLYVNGEAVEQVSSIKFLGLIMSSDLTWHNNTESVIGKARQRLYFLRKLKQARLPQKLLMNFYRCAIESVLTYGLSVWYNSCTVEEKDALQRVVRQAERIITGTSLPDLTTLSDSRCLRRARKIIRDRSHPGHRLFTRLPLGKRYRIIYARTTRFRASFFPHAVRLLNDSPLPPAP